MHILSLGIFILNSNLTLYSSQAVKPGKQTVELFCFHVSYIHVHCIYTPILYLCVSVRLQIPKNVCPVYIFRHDNLYQYLLHVLLKCTYKCQSISWPNLVLGSKMQWVCFVTRVLKSVELPFTKCSVLFKAYLFWFIYIISTVGPTSNPCLRFEVLSKSQTYYYVQKHVSDFW